MPQLIGVFYLITLHHAFPIFTSNAYLHLDADDDNDFFYHYWRSYCTPFYVRKRGVPSK